MPLLWFHAFDRDGDVERIVDVLLKGAGPTGHSVQSPTASNEERLGFGAPHVYAYLGNAHDQFGDNLLALDAMHGIASPFDTGGCIKHNAPVNGWSDDARKAFVRDFSFPVPELSQELERHPGASDEARRHYVRGTRPHDIPGPHAVWSRESPPAGLWTLASDWRSWTWEGRTPNTIAGANAIRHWTCATGLSSRLFQYVESSETLFELFQSLYSKYVHGGFSVMLSRVREGQIP